MPKLPAGMRGAAPDSRLELPAGCPLKADTDDCGRIAPALATLGAAASSGSGSGVGLASATAVAAGFGLATGAGCAAGRTAAAAEPRATAGLAAGAAGAAEAVSVWLLFEVVNRPLRKLRVFSIGSRYVSSVVRRRCVSCAAARQARARRRAHMREAGLERRSGASSGVQQRHWWRLTVGGLPGAETATRPPRVFSAHLTRLQRFRD